ncbi:MAG TPA: helix-turn-helix domain-containing protein [Candidatus Scatomorpha stercorigallinarum]|nr:helix-turn-helix domain-containing protein [Candidatus Scatomorpha stercorigallinarum]
MDSEKEKRPAKERSAKQAKGPRPAREPKEQREKKEQRRRERPIEASEVFVAAEESANDVFRKRLTYLMNGNNPQGKAVNIQELADAVGVSRPAIRKYLKPKGAPTTPSAATVCAIARFFGTTPDFLLGFDTPDTEAARKALESDYYNALGLNQRTIDLLRALRERQADERRGAAAAALMSMLDKQAAAFAEDALRLLDGQS